MNTRKPLLSVPLKFGITGAIMIIVMFTVFYFSSENPIGEISTFDFYILPIFIFLAIKEYRDTYNAKFMEFWQGMTVGFGTYISIAIITSVFILFFVSVINPSILDTYVASRIDILIEGKEGMIADIGEEAYLESLSDIKLVSLADVVLDNFLKKMMLGLFLAIAVSVIMKRKPKSETTD